MLFLFSITSGLFLGWSLGANDAANIFGSAVGSRMVRFRTAAIVASIFVVLGAVVQGQGASDTLSDLGRVDALAGAFTVSFCAAFTVYLMTRRGLPVSTGQAVVGGILGWTVFTGHTTDYRVLLQIVGSWVSGPILGMAFSALLFVLFRWWLRKLRIHVVVLDSYLRSALIVVGAFGAYSLGANNIANVMGVFVPSAPQVMLDFGLFSLNGTQLLFLVGGLAIATGIYTYSRKVMNTVGSGIQSLTPEAAVVVVLSLALVLFVFSSSSLSIGLQAIGLPALPLVPVSSTQVVVGAVLGIGLVKGAREIKPRLLGGIALGWIATPLIAGLLTWFSLFFMQNVFKQEVTAAIPPSAPQLAQVSGSLNTTPVIKLSWMLLLIVLVLVVAILLYYIVYHQKRRLIAENELLMQQNQLYHTQKRLGDLEVQTVQAENLILGQKLEAKRRELIQMALNISEQWSFLSELNERTQHVIEATHDEKAAAELKQMSVMVSQRMSFSREMEAFYGQVETVHKDFQEKLNARFPGLTEQEKRLSVMLRMNLSTKEIAALLNISPKSAETSRYRLRKRLGLAQGENLNDFFNNL